MLFSSSSLGTFYGEVKSLTWPDKIPGTNLEFDGIDDYILISSTTEFSPANNFTIEAWVMPDDIITSQAIFMHDEDGGGNDAYALTIQNEHALFHAHNGSSQVITF